MCRECVCRVGGFVVSWVCDLVGGGRVLGNPSVSRGSEKGVVVGDREWV